MWKQTFSQALGTLERDHNRLSRSLWEWLQSVLCSFTMNYTNGFTFQTCNKKEHQICKEDVKGLFYKYFFLYFSIQNNSMYIHTQVVYKIQEFSSYALKNIYFELPGFRRNRDIMQHVTNWNSKSLIVPRNPQGCGYSPEEDRFASPKCPTTKMLRDRKILKNSLCVLLASSIVHCFRGNIAVVPRKSTMWILFSVEWCLRYSRSSSIKSNNFDFIKDIIK